MKHIEKSLDSFFASNSKVLVIKGDWGVGKTFFWENYIDSKIKGSELSSIAYSYNSLFGKSSLEDVRKSIFHNAKEICGDKSTEELFSNEFDQNSKIYKKVPWLKDSFNTVKRKSTLFGGWSNKVSSLPGIDKFSGLISTLEYGLVKNYIVCFDDLERKGDKLSIREVMGLVDELSQRKDCKVVLIFNENSFSEEGDKEQFEEYREKVVDVELNHNPTCDDNISCIFPNAIDNYPVLVATANELEIKNIRVLRKLKWLIDLFDPYFKNIDPQIKEEFLLHATLLSWGFYIKTPELSYQQLQEHLSTNSWLSYMSNEEREKSASEKIYGTLASNLKLQQFPNS